MKKKVVLIGAGSAVFASELVADFAAEGGQWEIGLCDIDEKSLDGIYGLARKLVEAKSAPITLSKSTERRDLLEGADYVVTMLDVGGRRAWQKDVYIPRKYGIYHPVADTTTPGGFVRSLRILPTMVQIARDTQDLCPAATFLNYCNPMAAIVRAIRRETGREAFGLCHGVQGARKYLADFAGVDEKRCDVTAVGFNHFIWVTEFTHGGMDAYPLVRKKLRQLKDAGKLPDEDNQTSWQLYEHFGLFPASRDRHVVEFFPQFHADGNHYGKTLGADRFPLGKYVADGDRGQKRMMRVARGQEEVPQDLLDRKVGDHEMLVPLLRSMRSTTPGVYHVTLPNTGQVQNLPADLCIECPVEFSEAGARPVPVGVLPAGIAACVQKAFLTTELIVDAALQHDRAKFVQAIILDGGVRSFQDANALADELLAAHKEYLPGW